MTDNNKTTMTNEQKIEAFHDSIAQIAKQTVPVRTLAETDLYRSVKLALTTLTDRQQTAVCNAVFEHAGFYIAGTGGGCSAFLTNDEDEWLPAFMVTDANCSSPELISDDCLVGPHFPNNEDLFGDLAGTEVEVDGEYFYEEFCNWLTGLAWIKQDWSFLQDVERQIVETKAGDAIVNNDMLGGMLEDFVQTFVPTLAEGDEGRYRFEAQVNDGVMMIRLLGPMFDFDFRTLMIWKLAADRQSLVLTFHCGSGSQLNIASFDLDEFVNVDPCPIFEEVEAHLKTSLEAAKISREEYERRNSKEGIWHQKQERMTLENVEDDRMFYNAVSDCFRRIVAAERSIHYNDPKNADCLLTFSCSGSPANEMLFQLVADCDVDEDRKPEGFERWMLNAMRKDNGWTEGSCFTLDEDANQVEAFDLAEWIYLTIDAWRKSKDILNIVFAAVRAGSYSFVPAVNGRSWQTERFGAKLMACWISNDRFQHSLLMTGSRMDSKIQSTLTIPVQEPAANVVAAIMDFCHHMDRKPSVGCV